MAAGEKKADLFAWLVQYHCDVNLQHCLPYMTDGRLLKLRGQPLVEGYDEIQVPEDYRGLIIVANGDQLASRLKTDKVILDRHLPEPTYVPSSTDFFSYLAAQQNRDGGNVYDDLHQTFRKVREFNNNPHSLQEIGVQMEETLEEMLPADFVSADGSVPLDEIGNKTRLALKLPLAYPNTETHQIKATPYGNTSIGKVTHFGPGSKGLAEEFFFLCDPNYDGPFLNQEHSIIGVHRQYQRHPDRGIQLVSEQRVADPVAYFLRGR